MGKQNNKQHNNKKHSSSKQNNRNNDKHKKPRTNEYKDTMNSSSNKPNTSSKSNTTTSKLSSLQQQFSKKLNGARFRLINEDLYTSSGSDAFAKFQAEPELFDVYHEGFREQASHWPENPLDKLIEWIRKKHSGASIADMGCGDAVLASSLSATNKVYSFDLVSKNNHVIAADIANVPLQSNSVDIVVFCLSLMGSNIPDFLNEAYR